MYYYDQAKLQAGNFATSKPFMQFESVGLLELDSDPDNMKLYLVTGRDKVYLLGPDSGDEWAQLLTEEELQQFPYDIIWTGPEIEYQANSEKATELGKIILFNNFAEINLNQQL